MIKYDPHHIEKKWQKYWDEHKLSETQDTVAGKENLYYLSEFPYPSGNLHVGHWLAFAVPDITVRYQKMRGYNVLYPIGFDAFGLPAENAAIKNKLQPREWTQKNIAYMTKQLQTMGASFDWSRVVDTSTPEYYRWTQWIFLQFYKKGLAYRAKTLVNWCPKDNTVLANEQVIGGQCDRCGTEVVQKELSQWMLKITEYAGRLVDDLERLDWPETTKSAQRNWIGRSIGAEIHFLIPNSTETLRVFTTRPDTLFGVTYVVIAPEHPLVKTIVSDEHLDQVNRYLIEVSKKSEHERLANEKNKTGVFTGGYVVHPMSGEKIPVWIGDYVLGWYGTGAVMAVPAHDQRDNEFAKKFNLPIRYVIDPVIVREDARQIPEGDFVVKNKIVAVVENTDGTKVLTINWKSELGGRLLIGGTIESSESPEQTALREIAEETGYTDLEILNVASQTVHYKYYAFSKKQAFAAQVHFIHVRLKSDAQISQVLEATEDGNFTVEWLPKNQVASEIAEPLHAYAIGFFLLGKSDTEDGILSHSGEFSGLSSAEARTKIVEALVAKKLGAFQENYKLHDWVLSRQRYWGAPIPMIRCADCGYQPVSENHLPVVLPELEDYLPSPDGRSPLAKAEEWLKVRCPHCNQWAERETDTMDTFVDSSWYFLRYLDSNNAEVFADPKKMERWLPVDVYFGGAEHNTMHLLYSRFFTKALFDCGQVPFGELFARRINHGTILGPDGQKMSKSKGNVVDPDEQVAQYGADAVRMYLAFMGPYDHDAPWDTKGLNGVYRFLSRVWNLGQADFSESDGPDKALNITIKKVGEDIESNKFNTSVSELMKLLNTFEEYGATKKHYETFLKIIAPFAPHLTEEIWQTVLGHKKSIHLEKWPEYDPNALIEDEFTIPVQVNGKLRDMVTIPADATEDQARQAALLSEKVQVYTGQNQIKKVIYIPGKILNIII